MSSLWRYAPWCLIKDEIVNAILNYIIHPSNASPDVPGTANTLHRGCLKGNKGADLLEWSQLYYCAWLTWRCSCSCVHKNNKNRLPHLVLPALPNAQLHKIEPRVFTAEAISFPPLLSGWMDEWMASVCKQISTKRQLLEARWDLYCCYFAVCKLQLLFNQEYQLLWSFTHRSKPVWCFTSESFCKSLQIENDCCFKMKIMWFIFTAMIKDINCNL